MAARTDDGRYRIFQPRETDDDGRPYWPQPPIDFADEHAFNRYVVDSLGAIERVLERLLDARAHSATRWGLFDSEVRIFLAGVSLASAVIYAAHILGVI